MHLVRFSFLMLAYACLLVFAVVADGEASAATGRVKEPVSALLTTKSPKPQSEQAEQGQKPANVRVKRSGTPSISAHQPEVVQERAKPAPTELRPSSARGRTKVHKKVAPKAVVQPRTDLMYHGLLEDSQRYDPRPNYRTAGVANPQTPDLTHDHFLELDRNRDGKIDPVERAFGRLDMDRDLHDRQPR